MDKGKIKKKSRLRIPLGRLFLCRWWGVEPTRIISTRDFEFSGGFSIWCHLVIFKVIWCPTLKRKNNSTSNNFLINLRFFVAFPLGSDFSIWNAKKEIGGMFRRDAGQNAPLLRHKTKGKSRIMNQNQAKEYYKKLFVNYPDVLSVEEATTLLGFKSQTAIIRRIHQHRIRCLKVGRSFMIPKEYLIDYLLDS
jgi:excisionase family DNA binding protein